MKNIKQTIHNLLKSNKPKIEPTIFRALKVEVKFGQIDTENGLTISYENDELVVGGKVYLYNKKTGLNELISNGEYILKGGKTIVVEGGKIKSISTIKKKVFKAVEASKLTDEQILYRLSERINTLTKLKSDKK
jgi:hypothetical protein